MSTRAEHRRRARAEAKIRTVPVVPLVVPDRRRETLDRAVTEARRILPPLSGTETELVLFDPAEGLEKAAMIFTPERVEQIRKKLAELPPDSMLPTVILATRTYRDALLRRPPAPPTTTTTTTEGPTP